MLQETTLCYFLVKHQNKQKKIPINTFVNIVMEKTCTNFQRERKNSAWIGASRNVHFSNKRHDFWKAMSVSLNIYTKSFMPEPA